MTFARDLLGMTLFVIGGMILAITAANVLEAVWPLKGGC